MHQFAEFSHSGSGYIFDVHYSAHMSGCCRIGAGRKLERISLDSEVLKKQFGQLEKKLSRDRKFAIRVKLAELKRTIAGSRLENAEKIISELKTEMK